MPRVADALTAVSHIRSGMRVFVHGAAATPIILLEALVARAGELRDVEMIHLHTEGTPIWADPAYAESFRVANLFVGASMRKAVGDDRVDYLPCFLSEIPALFRSGRRPLHAALIHVSPPDAHGWCSLGTSVDIARAAIDVAPIIVAQINPRMPRVLGDGMVHISRITAWVDVESALPEAHGDAPGEVEIAIGNFAAGLIEDGATLQTGIGKIPDAVLAQLGGHKHLGVHSEMWSDGMLPLLESGAIDNSRKVKHAGKTVSGFVMGSRRLYDFIDNNPSVLQLDIGYVNDPSVIRQNPKVTAINSAVEVDLTGQVCADSIGSRIISGVGGQMDFIRGASLSEGGKPIIALTSRTRSGASRIVPTLKPGAGVVTTRAHVHWVITEYGIADLYGRTLGERAKALIEIAHPEDREALARAWAALRTVR